MTPRIKAVRKILSQRRCTHILITDPTDVEYISGFRSSRAELLISSSRLNLYTDFRYMEAAREFCKKSKWKLTELEVSDFKYLTGEVGRGSVLGVQSDVMTIDQFNTIKRALRGVNVVPISNDISNISSIKTEDEIDSMRKAARVGDKAFKALMPFIKKSIRELEVAKILENLCTEYGSEKPAFDTIVLFGERCALPHGRPGNRRLRAGDFVLIDFGCTVNGFCSDMTRTLVYGQAANGQREIYDIVLRAQSHARKAARASLTGKELDAAARDIIIKSGYGDFFGHGTGHGVGLKIHEFPRINKKADAALQENNVVTIEPGIYIPSKGGVRIEDMIVLKKNGATALTHSPRKLVELPL